MKILLYVFALVAILALAPLAKANGDYGPPPPPPVYQPIYSPPPATKKVPDWYAGVYGGANFAEDWGATFGPFSINSNTDTGGVVGVFVGKRIPSVKGLSFELEGNFRHADTSPSLTIVAPPPVITVSGDDRTIAALANLRYEVDLGGKVTPYILAGVGYGERTLSVDVIPIAFNFEQTKSDVVWQAGVGLDLAITDHMKAGVGYRFFDGPDFDQTVFGVVPFSGSGENHAVVAQLTFALN